MKNDTEVSARPAVSDLSSRCRVWSRDTSPTPSFTFTAHSRRSGTHAKTLSRPCLPRHTSLHTWPVATGGVWWGGRGLRLPRGINKHGSPEDVCKHLYLWVAVGTLAKDCRDRLFPASPRRRKHCFPFVSFS